MRWRRLCSHQSRRASAHQRTERRSSMQFQQSYFFRSTGQRWLDRRFGPDPSAAGIGIGFGKGEKPVILFGEGGLETKEIFMGKTQQSNCAGQSWKLRKLHTFKITTKQNEQQISQKTLKEREGAPNKTGNWVAILQRDD